jgi:hypothetical protein
MMQETGDISIQHLSPSLYRIEDLCNVYLIKQGLDEALRKGVEGRGIPPTEIADHVIAAIRADKF